MEEKIIDTEKDEEKKIDKKKEEEKEEKKYICKICSNKENKTGKIKCIYFEKCNHEICYICLYKLLIHSYIKQISQIHKTNNIIKVKCICEIGHKELSIKEIKDILTDLNNIISYPNLNNNEESMNENYEPKEIKCELHKDTFISEFCLECYEPICPKCIDNKNKRRKISIHCNHKTVSYKDFYTKLYSNLLKIPNLKIILDNHKNSLKHSYDEYCELINNKFESIINEIIDIKDKIIKNLKNEYDKYKPSIEAINLLYQYFNYELVLINKETDINQLMFLYNTKISLPEIKFQFSKAEIELDKIIKELNENNLENLLEYKFNSINAEEYKCIQTISDAHSSNIGCLCILNNKKIASGDYNGNIKIWKSSLNGYRLSQEIKNLYNGAINSMCSIYINKFAVCSPVSNEINIFHENINNEKYINIQKISLDKTDKFFNKINTLNDNISLIVTTKDYYVNIYQDKIGGIPKQNYMKTKYELVESFESIHTKEINIVLHTKNENIITASEDSTIKVWNKDRSYYTLLEHSDSVNVLIEIDNKHLCSGGSDKNIIIWYFNEKENKYTLKQICNGHEFSVIGLVYLNNDKLISASNDETLKIWQRNKYDLYINKITIKGNKLGFAGLTNINNDILVTYSWDKSIKIWISSSNKNYISNNSNNNINNNISINKEIMKKESNDNLSVQKIEKESEKDINNKIRKESVEYLVENSINQLTTKKDEDSNNQLKTKKNESNK